MQVISENPPLHKRLAKTCEMQAVPPPMTGNYLPSGPDIEIDDSQYTYGPEKTQPSEIDTCNSNISAETSELVSEPVVNKTNIEVQPKVWSDAPIIEEYESDSDDECVTVKIEGLDTPSFATKQNKGIIDSGYSRHMTGNKAYLADYQDINGGPVAFGGSKGYITDSINYLSVSSENQANIHAGQQESNQNAGTKDKIVAGDSEKEDESAQDCFEVPFWHSYSSTNTSSSKSDKKRGSPREEEQIFLDDLARLQRQEKEANEEAEALRKDFAQETKNLVTQAEAAKSSSTNIFSTVSTTAKASGTNFVNTVRMPVSTASANEGQSLSETTNSQEDDNEIPPLEDIHEDTTDGIFTHSSYDDEGAVADFTNLEVIMNVSPNPTSRIHPSTLILGDPTSRVQTRSKVNKSSEAHALTQEYFISSLNIKAGLCYARRVVAIVDYAGANLDRKSTTGGCQFLGRRLITWQCKKQTIVATSTTEAEYVAAASCCGQVLWIQNQMLDYGFNFMNTKIYIDNESTICIVKNPVYHSKTKHIAIRHHFIRDAYEKKLIQVLKIHTNDNVADLLTKAFDVSRFQFLVVQWD
ncbi:hypothetical protein Tco_0730207 [Tanacetum coccineum]|uniref:Uncharacterized protein n=1 Tax=Tanacetum coccineum TaxID=301880 RepID=A0ABQ4YTK7_9ASTR